MIKIFLLVALIVVELNAVTAIELGEQVYNCTFDSSSTYICDAKTKNPNGAMISNSNVELVDNYRITDVTSISNLEQLTENGEICQIPFTNNGSLYYHCFSSKNECKTMTGAFAKCPYGKFYEVKTPFSNGPFNVDLEFPNIDLPQPDEYHMQFYTLYLCENKIECNQTLDKISVNIIDDKNKSIAVESYFGINSVDIQRAWIRRNLEFKSLSNKIKLIFGFNRGNQSTSKAYFMIDNIEIFQVKQTTTQTTTTAQTTTSKVVSTVSITDTVTTKASTVKLSTTKEPIKTTTSVKLDVSATTTAKSDSTTLYVVSGVLSSIIALLLLFIIFKFVKKPKVKTESIEMN